MLTKILKSLLWVVAILIYGFSSSAQNSPKLKGIIQHADSIRTEAPTERLYLHLNKNLYSNIDTIWFKAYLFNPAFLTASEQSRILYLELSDMNSKVLKRTVLEVNEGLGWGQLSLAEQKLPAGSYTLRGYTNWMRNFPQGLVYQRNIYVYDFGSGYPPAIISAARQFKIDGLAAGIVGSQSKIDLQFMPEGGQLIAGIRSIVGFKAVDDRGAGVQVEGKILNTRNVEVASFKSNGNGLGSFDILPATREKYTARLSLPEGETGVYNLPIVATSGTMLKVRNDVELDSIYVELSPSVDLLDNQEPFYIIGHSRGVVCFGAATNFSKLPVKYVLAKSAFPTGISRITVLNFKKQIVNERLLFIDHRDHLNISVKQDKQSFATGDSIRFEINVRKKDGRPAATSLSMSVTREPGSERFDGSTKGSIISSLLLTSELDGFIEQPEKYLRMDSITGNEWEDLLLSAKGLEFNGKQLFSEKTIIKYPSETGLEIKGTVVNALNKPVENASVSLFSDKPFILMETKSDKEGRFIFRGFQPSETAQYLVRTKNSKGKSGNVSLKMDYFEAPVFDNNAGRSYYLNPSNPPEQPSGNASDNNQKKDKSFLLSEVKITAKKIISGSNNLNGSGNADLILDQQDLDAAGRMTLGDLLKERIKGFRIGVFPPTQNQFKDYTRLAGSAYPQYRTFLVSDKEVRLVIDGIDVGSYYENSSAANQWYDFMKYYLDNLKAEDISGVEMMYSWKYNSSYRFRHLSSGQQKLNPTLMDWVFIEITTKSGKGPFLQKDPSRSLYKTLPVVFPENFKKPEYSSIKDSKMDEGSTLFWAPNVVTDESGKARISFSSDFKPGTYTVIIEGTDMNGLIGYSRTKLTIK